MELNDISKDWRWVKLGEAGKIISGGTPSTTIPEYWHGNINWISPADLTGYKKKTIKKGAKSITDLGLKHSSARLMPKGSVLFSSRAPIGYVVIADEELCTNQGFKSIIPNDHVTSDYLYYFLLASKQQAEKVASGTTFKEISLTKFAELDFPLPPKETQQSIVSKIEELFSELDKSVENLRIAHQQLKTYRQAVLKWAFEGKLTEEWRKQHGTRVQLPPGAPTERSRVRDPSSPQEENGELPEGWEWVKLGDVCSLITDGKHGDCQNEDSSGYYFLSAKDVRNNTLLYENSRQITKKDFEETHRRTNLKPGDICLVNTGATIGRISIAPNDARVYKTTFQKSVAVIKCIETVIDNKFCSYRLRLDLKRLVKVSSGTAVPNLLLGSLKAHLIALPYSVAEQQQIVQEIENRLSVTDKLEETINQSLQQAEALRQSILKKAFEGRLV